MEEAEEVDDTTYVTPVEPGGEGENEGTETPTPQTTAAPGTAAAGNEVKPGEGGQVTTTPLAALEDYKCPDPQKDQDVYVICVDVEKDSDRIRYGEAFPTTGGVLLPNRPVVVRVRHPADRRVTVTATGGEGVYTPSIMLDLPSAQGDVSRGGKARGRKSRGNVPFMVTQRTLPPRLPGSTKIRVAVEAPGARGANLDSVDFDFQVLETFIGAMRIGVAAVGLGAVNAEYEVRTVAGSAQPQIASKGARAFEYEAILGYAPFFDKGGRPSTGCTAQPWCVAPFLGFGVVSPRADGGFDFLTSLHLGAEWEPVRSFSIALTLVGRRVERLASGLVVGAPAVDGQALTQTQYALGAALVFNLSPQFLTTALKGAAEVIK
jgi:hypothetical protein